MASVSKKQLREAVNFGGDVDESTMPRLLDVCINICSTYGLSADELSTKWDMYCMNRKIETATVAHLEALRRDLALSMKSPVASRTSNSGLGNKVFDSNTLSQLENKLFTPPPSAQKRKAPDSAFASSQAESVAPTSLIPPSPSYHLRDQKGKLEAQFIARRIEPLQVPTQNHCDKKRVDVLLYPDQQTSAYRYQFEKLAGKAAVQDERIDIMAELLVHQNNLGELQHPCLPRQEECATVGKICCDAFEGKLNPSSLLLEASRSIGNGNRVKLDVSATPSFSVFPGQIVAAVGTNSTGESFQTHRLIPGCPMAYEQTPVRQLTELHYSPDKQNGKPLVIHIASGPYALEDSLDYEPFADLMAAIEKEVPDVLILMGPFVDADHPKIKTGEISSTLEDVFKDKIANRLHEFKQKGHATQIIMVPSLLDANHHFVFPQAPFGVDRQLPKDVLCYPNPVTFSINELTVGISTNDILMHLSREEVSRRGPNDIAVDRMARLAEHVLQQRHYYPLFPPAIGAQIDYCSSAPLCLPITPDLLILPSDLKCFAKQALTSTVCINPGRLTRKRAGGTYAKVVVYPLPRSADADTQDRTHDVAERTRVEIYRI